MNKFIKRGIYVGLASGFIAMLFGGWATTVLAVLGGVLLGFTSTLGMGEQAEARFKLRPILIGALIFSVFTAIGGLIFDLVLAGAAVLTPSPAELTITSAVLAVILGTLVTVGMAYVQSLPDKRRVRRLDWVIFIILIVLFPFVDQLANLSWAASVIFAGIYVLLALGLNIVVGYAGILNLGYAAFFGFGAYATALLSSQQLGIHINYWLIVWIATGVAAIAGILLGAPTLGLRGDYLAIITLGFGEIVPVAFQQLIKITIQEPITCLILPAIQSIGGGTPTVQCLTLIKEFDLTGGVRGINPVDRPVLPIIDPTDGGPVLILKITVLLLLIGLVAFLFRRSTVRGGMTVAKGIGYVLAVTLIFIMFVPVPHIGGDLFAPVWNTVQPGQFASDNLLPWYFLLLGMIAIVIFLSLRLKSSRLGRAWTSLREDELAANQMGINLVHTKLTAFAVGAAIAGIAGAFYTAYVSAVFPDVFGFNASIIILSAIVLGGIGNIPGVILGALIIFVSDGLLLKSFQTMLNGLQQHVLLPAFTDPHVQEFIRANLDPVKYRYLLLGLVLVLVMAFRPEGLLPAREQRLQFHEAEPEDTPKPEEPAESQAATA